MVEWPAPETVLGSLRLPWGSLADKQKAAFKKAVGVSGGKDECPVRLKGRTLIEEPLLYLCDNQSLLKAVNR